MNQPLTVAIIGGGFCGTMVAVHLLSQATQLEIILINAGSPLCKGLAYSSYSHKHLLNVRAKNMSAFPDRPTHFIDWLKRHENYHVIDRSLVPDMFLPRNIYGHYMKDIFEDAIRKKPETVSINFVHDEAIDLELNEGRANIFFSVSPPITADKVILATGNHLPGNVKIETPSFYSSKHYFANPWLHEAVNHPELEKDILIIGNGLTMADVVMGLKEKKYKGKIFALSTNGFDIVPHRLPEPYTKFIEELKPPYSLEKLLKLFDKHIHELGAKGEEIIDSLRPLLQQIWMGWTYEEKKWFVSHIRHLWEVARHRLPMQVHEQIQQLIIDDKLEIIAARIIDMQEEEDHINVRYRRKRDQKEYTLKVARVINCTGPVTDISKMQRPLFENLLLRELIQPDPLKLGINATAEGSILNADGTTSDFLYTLGGNLKGVLWESTAVPELRIQAQKLAKKLVKQQDKAGQVLST